MAEADPLEAWAVATFDVVGVALLAVFVGHVTGGLTDTLPNVGTVRGLLAFVYLWALTVVATRWALSEGGLDGVTDGELTTLTLRGAAAGVVVGAGFFVGAALAGVVVVLFETPPSSLAPVASNVLPFLAIVVVGGAVAGVVGSAVAAACVLVDAACYWLVERAVRPGAVPSDS